MVEMLESLSAKRPPGRPRKLELIPPEVKFRADPSLNFQPPPDRAETQQFDTTTPVDVTVTKFSLADIPASGDALLTVLSDVFPNLHARNFPQWISYLIGSNTHMFLKTKNVIALAAVTNDPIDPRPKIEEVFLFSDVDPHHEDTSVTSEILAVYRKWKEWGKSMGAKELVMGRHSICPVSKTTFLLKCETRQEAVLKL